MNESIKLTWLSRSRAVVERLRAEGLRAEWTYSFRGIVAGYRAGLHITDADSRATAFWLSGGARTVNLFHGIALKHIGRDISVEGHHLSQRGARLTPRRVVQQVLAPWLIEPYDTVVASSPANAEVMRSAYRTHRPPLVTGLPRNDALTCSERQLKELFGVDCSGGSELDGGINLLYAPTFRDSQRVGRAIPLDWPELNRTLKAINGTLHLKLHPNDRASLPDLTELDRIVEVPAGEDLYLFMRRMDGLITDYSSIFFDFALRDKPIFFFAYDLDGYLSRDRGFYYDYATLVPGPIARTGADLNDGLRECFLEGADGYAEKRCDIRQRFHENGDLASARVLKELVRDSD